MYQYNSSVLIFSNVCVYCILPHLSGATGYLGRPFRTFIHFHIALGCTKLIIFSWTLRTQNILGGCLRPTFRTYPEVMVPWGWAAPWVPPREWGTCLPRSTLHASVVPFLIPSLRARRTQHLFTLTPRGILFSGTIHHEFKIQVQICVRSQE